MGVAMTRIGNVDHVLMLLRQQLHKLNETNRKTRSRKAGSGKATQSKSSLQRIIAMPAKDGMQGEIFERALVRALLVDEMGEAVAEDYRFDKIAGEVYRIISSDEETRALLLVAARQARES